MKNRRTTRAALVVTAAAAAIGLAAPAAFAASVDFSTAGMGNAGYAVGSMGVSYPGKYQADVTTMARDVCGTDTNGNGYGAYMYVRINYTNGSTLSTGGAFDNNGCGSTPEFWDFHVANNNNKPIASISARLCEEDHNGSQPDLCTGWKSVDNPNT